MGLFLKDNKPLFKNSGIVVSCASGNCCGGACCKPDGTCVAVADKAACDALSGSYRGNGSVCNGSNCCHATGICCCGLEASIPDVVYLTCHGSQSFVQPSGPPFVVCNNVFDVTDIPVCRSTSITPQPYCGSDDGSVGFNFRTGTGVSVCTPASGFYVVNPDCEAYFVSIGCGCNSGGGYIPGGLGITFTPTGFTGRGFQTVVYDFSCNPLFATGTVSNNDGTGTVDFTLHE